mmetsp:Transcript_15616/g.36126  ORF Transcript_15616/g.36126 Transcript_15616/m.36126 type:complete len:204 (-) Transcript_15616:59-670(-)
MDVLVPKEMASFFDANVSAAFEPSLACAFAFATDFTPNEVGALLAILGAKETFLLLLVGTFSKAFAPKGVGALLDMGGNSAFELLAGAFATGFAPNGVGALLDIGGKVAVEPLDIGTEGFSPVVGVLTEDFMPKGDDSLLEIVEEVLNGFVLESLTAAVALPVAPNRLLVLNAEDLALNAENGLLEEGFSVGLLPNEENGLLD